MTMQVSKTIGATDKVALDAPIFDPVAFRLSDEQAGIIARAREIGQSVFAGRAATYDREATFPIENYRDLHRVGLLGIAVPKKHGGLGTNFQTYALAAAEIGRYCGATALTWNMHVCSTLWSGPLADDLDMDAETRAEHERRRAIHYKRIVEDGAIYSQPFSEGGAAAAGGVAFSTEAKPVKGGWIINGKKIFASLSGHADYYGVLCTEIEEGEKASRRNTLYLAIPAKSQGVSVVGDWDPLGMRGTVSRTLLFKDVFVPDDSALMPRGVYFQAAMRWPHMFLTLSPTYMGLAQAAYDFTVRYLRGEVPGMPPVKRRMYSTKQIAVAQMQIKLEQIKAIWFQAVTEARANPSKEQVLRAYAAQYSVMEGANELAALAIRTCGGQAMLRSLPLERIYRDSRCGSLMLPWTAELCLDRNRNAAFAPDKTAIAFEGGRLSYAAFAARIERIASALKNEFGVGRGDRIAILSLNRPDYLVLLYACARLGAMLVPLNWRLAIAEQLFILTDAGAKVLVLEQAFEEVLPELEQTSLGTAVIGFDFTPLRGTTFESLLARVEGGGRNPHTDLSCPLLIVYTSGTTGRPKGAVLRQEALFWNGVMSQHMHNMTSDDHVLTVLPFFHVGGLNIQTTPALQLGATVTIHARFTPDTALAAIEHDRPTLTVMVPAIIQAVSDHPAWATTDFSSLKAVATGSTIVPPHLIDRFVARGVPVLQVYGSTETCPVAVYTRLGGDLSRTGSTGLAGLCCEAKVIDQAGREVPVGTPGEIAVRGPNVFFEYWGNTDATRDALHDGWYRTGDIGLCDADGYFWVRDRKKNMIISGGENVYPAEVERVLLEHPDVSECAVIGRPDPRWDEVPVAYVIRRSGCRLEADELRAHLQAQLARYKVPRDIVFVTDLPRTALGKVQHFLLKQLDAQSRAQGEAS